MNPQAVQQKERRRDTRREPMGQILVRQTIPVLPISDAEILNTSRHGVAIQTRAPIKLGDRLSFSTHPDSPPILAEVLGIELLDDGSFRVRCRCLLGGFEGGVLGRE